MLHYVILNVAYNLRVREQIRVLEIRPLMGENGVRRMERKLLVGRTKERTYKGI